MVDPFPDIYMVKCVHFLKELTQLHWTERGKLLAKLSLHSNLYRDVSLNTETAFHSSLEQGINNYMTTNKGTKSHVISNNTYAHFPHSTQHLLKGITYLTLQNVYPSINIKGNVI